MLNVKSEIKSLVLGLVNFFSLVLIGGFLLATLLAIISISDRYIFVFFLILPFIPIFVFKFSTRDIRKINSEDKIEIYVEKLIDIQVQLEKDHLARIVYRFIENITIEIIIAHFLFPWIVILFLYPIARSEFSLGSSVLSIILGLFSLFLSIRLIYKIIKRNYTVKLKRYLKDSFFYSITIISYNFIVLFLLIAVFVYFENTSICSLDISVFTGVVTSFLKPHPQLIGKHAILLGFNVAMCLTLIIPRMLQIFEGQHKGTSNDTEAKYAGIIKKEYKNYLKKDKNYKKTFFKFFIKFSMNKKIFDPIYISSLRNKFAIKRVYDFVATLSGIFTMFFFLYCCFVPSDCVSTYMVTLDGILVVMTFAIFIKLFKTYLQTKRKF